MPQVRVRRVLEQIESDMGPAMHNALRSVAPNAQIDARVLVRAIRNELEGRAPSWVEVRENHVQDWSPAIPETLPEAVHAEQFLPARARCPLSGRGRARCSAGRGRGRCLRLRSSGTSRRVNGNLN